MASIGDTRVEAWDRCRYSHSRASRSSLQLLDSSTNVRIRPSNVLLKRSAFPGDCGCLTAPVFTRTPKYLQTDSTSAFRNSDPLSMQKTFGRPQRLHSAVNALATEEASCRANGITFAYLVNDSTATSTQW